MARRVKERHLIREIKISREKLELAAVIVMALCALTVLTMPFGFKKTLTFDKGRIVYTGIVKNNKMNGQGTLTYKNGDKYQGNFSDGQFDGQGTFTSKDGWTYKGDFDKGQADGQGTLTTADGTVYKGTFKQGIYQQ
ncbi:MORN repeat-containing protein [Streptococcus dentapri]|uniref:MORN repeat-containing protein n=1 Tax=Streptococcus dentapri TaxID=573564 RepID=A0ABV8D173_9STRE